MDRIRRSAMRILSIRADHVGFRAACTKGESDRCGYRSGNARQYLPLRNLFCHPRSDPPSGSICEYSQAPDWRRAMSAVLQKLNRRNFLKTSAAAAGGLMLGFYLPENNELDAQSNAG